MNRRQRILLWGAVVSVYGLLIWGRLGQEPFDDAHFFGRFARNFLAHGVFAWNPDEPAVYGNTSQLFQAMWVPIAAVSGDYSLFLTRLLSVAALGLAAALLLERVPLRQQAGACLVLISPMALATLTSGMETAWAIALGAAVLALERQPRAHPVLWGLAGVAAYTLRPDSLLLVALTLAFSPRRSWREKAQGLAGMAAGIGLCLLAFRAYYGTALPLAFYLKSGQSGLYGSYFLEKSGWVKREQLAYLALCTAPAVFLALRSARQEWLPLLAPAGIFVAYHALATVEVMGFHARFYAPALPWFAVAASRGLQRPLSTPLAAGFLLTWAGCGVALYQTGWVPTAADPLLARTPAWMYIGYVGAWGALLWPIPVEPKVRAALVWVTSTTGLLLSWPPVFSAPPTDAALLQSHQQHLKSFRGLDAVRACLGPDTRVFHTEIGVPGALFPSGAIGDMGGLMTPALTFGEEDVDSMCLREQPEVLYLPHPNYRKLNRRLREGRCLDHYVAVLPGRSSLRVRRDLTEVMHCFRQEQSEAERVSWLEGSRPAHVRTGRANPPKMPAPGLWSSDALGDQIAALEAIGYVGGSEPAPPEIGVTVNTPRAMPGLNFYVSGHGPEATLMTLDGEVLHTWRKPIREIWPDRTFDDRRPEHQFWRRAALLDDGAILAIYEGHGLVKLDRDSEVLWAWDGGAHHDLEVLDDGRIWVLSREGRLIPTLHPRPILVDFATLLDADGTVLRQISLLDAVLDSGAGALYRQSDKPAGDIFHTNSLTLLDGTGSDRNPAFAEGRILLSMRRLSALMVLDPTTEEMVWWHTGAFREQHDPKVLPHGDLLLFDNLGETGDRSTVLQLDLQTHEARWSYQGTPEAPFFSRFCGTAERLENGNTLITESSQGRVFEVTDSGRIVWTFHNPERAGEADQYVAIVPELLRLPESAADFLR